MGAGGDGKPSKGISLRSIVPLDKLNPANLKDDLTVLRWVAHTRGETPQGGKRRAMVSLRVQAGRKAGHTMVALILQMW